MKSFKHYLRETMKAQTDQQDNPPHTFIVTVRDLIDALEIIGTDRTVEIRLEFPEYDTITVKFFGVGEEGDDADVSDLNLLEQEERDWVIRPSK